MKENDESVIIVWN